jgi:Galactose oxidase, central domain/Kelch motif
MEATSSSISLSARREQALCAEVPRRWRRLRLFTAARAAYDRAPLEAHMKPTYRRLAAFMIAASLTGCAGGGIAEQPVYYTNLRGQRVAELQMTTPRADAAAVALRDGRVLICGGTVSGAVGGVLSSAEIYDPAARTFTPTGSMTVAREGETATLLSDGRVLVAGGARNIGFRAELASAELYDPATGAFTATGSMHTAREGHTATLLRDGRVLVAGGSDNGVHTLSSAEIYDPASGGWTRAGDMTQPREAQVAVRMNSGKVLIAGGGRGDVPGGYIAYQTAEIYEPAAGIFTAVSANMNSDRVGAGAVLLDDGRVLIAGGKSSKMILNELGPNLMSLTPLRTAEVFDPETSTFIKVGDMREPHYLPTMTRLRDGGVLVVGGWRMEGPLIVGMRDAEIFEPYAGRFVTVGPTHVARLENTATILPDGEVLIAGGIDGRSNITAAVEFFDPARHGFVVRAAGRAGTGTPRAHSTQPPPM